jgi:subtilisin family serine protease
MEVTMTRVRFYSSLMVSVFIYAAVALTCVSQVNLQIVGQYEYAQFHGVWFTVVEGKRGDIVDTNHVIVRLRDRENIATFDFKAARLPALKDVRGRFADGFYELEIPRDIDSFEAARMLHETGMFDEVLFNIFLELYSTPNDDHYPNQWNLPKISTPDAWNVSTGSSDVIVAVIDVGADYEHEDLVGNLWPGIGYDFYGNNPDPYPYDEARHGTAVVGIVGAETDNGIGVAGVAGGWDGMDGIRLMHLRAGHRWWDGEQWQETISVSAASQATDSAATWGAGVINMSFGGTSQLPTLESAINRAVNNYNMVVVASAGNYRQGQPTTVRYPAAYSNVIAVGATTPNDTRKELNDGTEWWWGSCFGPELDVMAPGVYIWTTDLTGSIGYSQDNYYDSFNGTSAAAPHVAGVAALIRSLNPNIPWYQVRETIRFSADKVSEMGGQDFHNNTATDVSMLTTQCATFMFRRCIHP